MEQALRDLQQRVTKLEERMDHQREYSAGYRADIKEIKQALNKLAANEARMKWVLIGGISTVLLQQMGLVEFLKKVLL